MEETVTKTVEPTGHRIRSLFHRSDASIRIRLIACFVLIVVLMMAADAVAVWQFRQMAAPAERLRKADQTSHSVVRVHLDVDTFRDSMAALAGSHDAVQFSGEAASIRRSFLQHVDQAAQALRATPDIEQGATVSSALESLRMTLLSQLDTAVQLANAGEWGAVRLRLENQIPALIEFSSSLVERVDQQVLQERTTSIEDTQQARQRLFIIVSIAAVLTLLAAPALGWYVTRTITVPLCQLTASAEALAQGNFQHEVNVRGDDELAVLGKAFNYAARQLQQLYQDLRRSEQELRDVINLVPANVWSTTADGAVDFVNERWLEFTGLTPQDAMGWNWEAAVHPDDRSRHVRAWRTALKNGQVMESELRVRRADGKYRWWFSRNVPLRDKRGKIVKWYGTGIDIDDRKRAEEALREARADLAHINRVSMMGELAASMAHEIKQPITAAVTNARTGLRWLQRDPPEIEEARDSASRIIEDVIRAAEIIDRLRCLYRKDAPREREVVDVNEIAREMMVLLRSEATRYSIAICTELAADLPKITADRVQLQQVFMNLMLNGVEAMKDSGGELTIKSERIVDGDLLITIRDTGVGLPTGKVDEIFSAFFTTKAQGTGMGLSISRTIVESHGGRLWASANGERGATFRFTLPAGARASSSSAA